ASGPADPDTGGMNAAMSVRRPSTRADPTIAAVVPLGLLGQGLEELTHELFARQALEGGQLLGRELGEVLGIAQPLQQPLRDVVAQRAFDASEHTREDLVVGGEEGLALHQAGAAQVVEAQQARAVQPLLQRCEKRLPLLDGDRDALLAQAGEEIEEHAATPPQRLTGCSAGPGRPTWRDSGRRAR